jgi:hypothetical protein
VPLRRLIRVLTVAVRTGARPSKGERSINSLFYVSSPAVLYELRDPTVIKSIFSIKREELMTSDTTGCFVNGTTKRDEYSLKEETEHRFPDVNEIFDGLSEYTQALLRRKPETN